ncbi:hypothetical protein JCM10213_006984 [Rhodosporidiobolus nylandii]
MRASTFSLAFLFAIAAFVAAVPVIPTGEAIRLVEPTVFETPVEVNALEKRAASCKLTADCKQAIPANSHRYCSSGKCTFACNSGYTKSGSGCTKKASTSPSSVNLSTSSYSGQGTFYYQNGVPGACGSVSSDGAYIVALQTKMYANGAHCGKTINIKVGSKTIQAKVMDACPTCGSAESIDLSVGAFKELASLDQGVVNLQWSFAS